ncbi:MAG TPA: polysaccharide biosynthesis C-terminal domain-containing protein, partial [Gemmatimonadales bacterium]|nr:polysaccharide biosynthesis C-terminal domain-containing protein [Gemmatimonadales bacterium]
LEAQRLLRRALKHLLLALGPIVAILIPLAPDILRLLFGAEYAARGTLVLQVLAVGVLVNCLAFLPVAMTQAAGRPDLSARFHLIEMPIHVALVWLLVGRWGINGAALAWSARVALDAVLQFGGAVRLGTLPRRFLTQDRLPQAVALLVLLGMLAWLLAAVVAPQWLRLTSLALLLLSAAGTGWRYLLDGAEREQLTRLLRPAVAVRSPEVGT